MQHDTGASTPAHDEATKPLISNTVLGVLWAISHFAMGITTMLMPREDKANAMREVYRGWHYSIGLALTIFSIWVLVRLWKQRKQRQRQRLSLKI